MFRTPAKMISATSPPTSPPRETLKPDTFTTQTKVRRNIGEQDTAKVLFPEESPAPAVQPNRLQQARAWVTKAKMALNASRNLKSDIKASVIQAIDRLYQIIKEAEAGKPGRPECSSPQAPSSADVEEQAVIPRPREEEPAANHAVGNAQVSQLLSSLAEHSQLMRESNERADKLREALAEKRESLEVPTYASVAAIAKGRKRPEPTALHSVVVTSRDEMETGEEVMGRIRTAINAKAGNINIDRIRKAKDRKIVIGCRSEEERDKVQSRIEAADDQLEVLVVKNQDPLIILRDVLGSHKDEEILEFLRMQNGSLFRDLPAGDDRAVVRFRKRAKSSILCHVVLQVSPYLWRRFLEASEVYLDLQLIKAEDQSPLVQCSMCLGYGHSRRLCTEKVEKCGYCGGPHQRRECAEKLANAQPTCCNCTNAKMEATGHYAFSMDCPVRRKWDALARAKTAYC